MLLSLERAMREIERELETNDGVYRENRGRLSQAELCRRAGVAQMTLQNYKHKHSTLSLVNHWLHQTHIKYGLGKKAKLPYLGARKNHELSATKLATHYNICRLEVLELSVKLKELEQQVHDLAAELVEERTKNARLEIMLKNTFPTIITREK